ncbi:hypothetical protein [Paenibacillus protaetiae]|uniref:hypothetical protein n=1 Tax=Paenibacillus protaetiae TaxID=2509456 RepID=UPI0013ECC739|nr:hypothetical protein [Paenibacillus protaetiae]
MSRLRPGKLGTASGKRNSLAALKPGAVFTSPSTDGRDREYVVVFERKATYKKPSFL